jgi:uncharacterized protein
LEKRDHRFFKAGLGARESWRAFSEFRDSCVYLDIETDGGVSLDCITTIGMYDGHEFKVFIKGKDLESFPEAIAPYGMVVTFFGTGFDVPVLQKRFPKVRLDQIHVDLCPAMRQLGYRGGLKRIERQLGIRRSPQTVGLTGFDAVMLWRRYANFGDKRALERLVAYNREDVVNLERVADFAYQNLRQQVFVEPCNS